MNYRIKVSWILLLLQSMVACALLPNSAPLSRTKISKSLEGRQCMGQRMDMSMIRAQLERQNIRVYTQFIGNDDVLRPSVCGAPDGKIAIFEIESRQLRRAINLGFIPYTNL